MQSLLVLGRQPELGIAELESIYGKERIRKVGHKSVIVDVDPCLLAFDRLGGSVKFAKVLLELDTNTWKDAEKFLIKASPEHSKTMPEGKMLLGLSAIGFNVSTRQIEATGLSIKKVVRKTGRPVRLIPNKEPELNAAQIIHNKLLGPNGWELLIIKAGPKTIIAQTVKVQDIDGYTARDRERPKRDTKVGMLPPKLAQIIINLAVGNIPDDKLSDICEIPADQEIPAPNLGQTILDPFCGTGVILQEALLMGYGIYGSDKEQRMVDYSESNISWLHNFYSTASLGEKFETADATSHQWTPGFDYIASELYLGRPFSAKPDAEILARNISDTNLIIKRFLQNLAPQLTSGARICLAVPAWQVSPGNFKHLPLIDQISDLGYNHISFEQPGTKDLIYFREGQIVARELIVLSVK